MKFKIYTILFSLILFFSISAFAQTPPPPNGGNGDPGAGNNPVGGGAPIAGGLEILLALGSAYGVKKLEIFSNPEKN